MNDAAETSACAPENAVPMDITLRVLGDLMNETMALMDDTVSLGDQRNATGEAGPHEIAIGLRLAARLARVGGWLMLSLVNFAALRDEKRAKSERDGKQSETFHVLFKSRNPAASKVTRIESNSYQS